MVAAGRDPGSTTVGEIAGGRSVKGQHTQAGRLGADRIVVVGADTDISEVTA